MTGHVFSLIYEVISGYLRGFGISLSPAIFTMIGVCGIRFAWIELAFPANPTFMTIMLVYPISLAATALLMVGLLIYHHPSRRAGRMKSIA